MKKKIRKNVEKWVLLKSPKLAIFSIFDNFRPVIFNFSNSWEFQKFEINSEMKKKIRKNDEKFN